MLKDKSKKDAAIVFGVTKDYAFALANVLVGMKKHCRTFWDDIIVYHDGISGSEKKSLNSILTCEFREMNLEKLNKYHIKKDIVDTYSLMVLSRFFCFDMLNNYKKVIWHDVDILVQGDFSGLLEYGNKSGLAMTKTDDNFYVESNFFKKIDQYSMYKLLYNSGIIVFSDSLLKYKELTNWCFSKTEELGDTLRYPDQGILNLMIQEFNIEVEDIDIVKYCCHPRLSGFKKAAIVHAYGIDKFWNSDKLAKQFPEWHDNAKLWHSARRKTLSDAQDKISVVMSVYDRADFLGESLASILGQTYSNIEVVIVVECSDKQKEINKLINAMGSKKIRIINNDSRLGFAESLNIAIENSTGKFIARMDDDDISVVDRFEKQVRFMDNNPEIGICGTYVQCFGNCTDKWSYVPTDPNYCKIQLLFSTVLYHPTVMMRRSVLVENKLYYDKDYFTEDYELWSRAIKHTKIANLPEFLLQYRVSGQNVTSNNSDKVHNSHLMVMKNQFSQYLGIDLSYDELQVVNGRIIISNLVFNSNDAIVLRETVYDKIIAANRLCGFYDHEALAKYLGRGSMGYCMGLMPNIKKLLKLLLSPLIKAIKTKLYWFVKNQLYWVEYRLGILEKDSYSNIDK